jgi:hypothetical protein
LTQLVRTCAGWGSPGLRVTSSFAAVFPAFELKTATVTLLAAARLVELVTFFWFKQSQPSEAGNVEW